MYVNTIQIYMQTFTIIPYIINNAVAYRKLYIQSKQYNIMSDKTIELTDEEIEKVNKIISSIKSDINEAINYISNNSFELAVESLKRGLTRTDCPVCHKKLKILAADVTHTKEVCNIDEKLCLLEKEEIQKTAISIKDEFIPIATEKRAKNIKSKIINNKLEDNVLLLPHEFIRKLFYDKQ
jgi:hypothetical protein